MPIFNGAVTKTLRGQQIPAPEVLREGGPFIPMIVKTGEAQTAVLQKAGKKPLEREGHALIDTGASRTAVDLQLAKEMGLPVIGRAHMSSASHESVIMPVFSGNLEVPGFAAINVPDGLLGANLDGDKNKIIVLIGRDLLAMATFHYNGPEGSFTLCI